MTQFHTLVASDLDGTLLPEGQTELPCAVFDEIRRLHDCGVLFCAASGRPLDALRRLFAPVAATILYQPLPPRRIWTRWALSLGTAVS